MNRLENDFPASSFRQRPVGVALATAALIAGFYLLPEQWGHVPGYLPYLLLLAWPHQQRQGITQWT